MPPAPSRFPIPELKAMPEDIRARILAFFALSNRFANLENLRSNDEFYLLGRVPVT